MNNGLVPGDWTWFFLASAIVGAVLAGLVAVGLSPVVQRIAAVPGGVARAAEAILVSLTLALLGLAGLWPADDPRLVGVAITVVGVGAWLVLTGILVAGGGRGTAAVPALRPRTVPRLAVDQLATLPAVAAGLLLIGGVTPGLDPILLSAGASTVGGLWLGALLLLDLPTA